MTDARKQRMEMLLKMLAEQPNDTFLIYALALEHAADSTTIEKAISLLQRCLEIDPDYIAAYYQLGQLLGQSEVPQALEYYRKGLEIARQKRDLKAAGEFEQAIFMLEDDL